MLFIARDPGPGGALQFEIKGTTTGGVEFLRFYDKRGKIIAWVRNPGGDDCHAWVYIPGESYLGTVEQFLPRVKFMGTT